MGYRQRILTSCVIPFALAAGAAQAQAPAAKPAEPAKTAKADDASSLSDIIVTAQRREERLQDIPVVVSAFTPKLMERLQINDTIRTSKFVPGMISQHNAGLGSANAYFLRGLGNALSVATFDAPVTTYVDDIYVARQNANNYAFFDTERVEVLRGPQGTLFGRNTTGGAVSVIMRKPSPTAGFSFEATGGSYDRYTVKATADMPLSDKVLTKLSGYYISDRGYLKNITTGDWLNGEKSYGIRGDVRYLASPSLTVDLAAEYTLTRPTNLGLRNAPGANPYLFPPTATTTPVFYETAAGLPKAECNGDSVNQLLTTGTGNCSRSPSFAASGKITYDTPAGTFNYIVGYRRLTQGYINQYDGSTVNKYAGYIIADNGKNAQWSHEFKFNGKLADNRIHYVAGVFYLRETTNDRTATFNGGTTSFKVIQDQHLLHKVETAAVYAQADFDVTDQFTLTAGARYTWERKDVGYLASAQFPGFGYTSAQVAAFGIPLEQTQKRVTPRFAASYKITPDAMLFVSATNGFKSGGWNGGSAAPQNAVAFRPERTWSYEGGLKSEWLGHRLRFNPTFFYANTQDLQATAAVVSPITKAIVSLPFNAGTLRVYGLEIESSWVVNSNFNLFANVSYQNGKYTYIVPTTTALTTSTKPVRIPPFQFSGGIAYNTPVEELKGSVGASVTYRHNSPYWVALLNTTKAPVENYVDAAINYKTADEKWGLSFEVTNLTNQKSVNTNFLSLFANDPRRYTARLKFTM